QAATCGSRSSAKASVASQPLSKTQKLICERSVGWQGREVCQAGMSPVERSGRSGSNSRARRSVLSQITASRTCCTTLGMCSAITRRRVSSSVASSSGSITTAPAHELLHQRHQLRQQQLAPAMPAALELIVEAGGGLEDQLLHPEALGEVFE